MSEKTKTDAKPDTTEVRVREAYVPKVDGVLINGVPVQPVKVTDG